MDNGKLKMESCFSVILSDSEESHKIDPPFTQDDTNYIMLNSFQA